MGKRTLRMAGISSVALLGLVAPGAFSGSVSADSAPETFPLHCDLDGNSRHDPEYVASHYEKFYNFVLDDDEVTWRDPKSRAWFAQEERIGVPQVKYVRLTGPGGQPDPDPSLSFTDYTVEWFDVYFAPDIYPNGKPPGKTVRCINIADPYEYTIPEEEAAIDVEHRLVAGATYIETDYQLFEIGLENSPEKHDGDGHGHGRGGHSHSHRSRGKH